MPQHRVEEEATRDPSAVWDQVRMALRSEVTEVTFHIWIQPLEPAALVGRRLYVRAPEHVRTWVEQRFLPLLRRAGTDAGVEGVDIVDAAWQYAAPTEDGDRGAEQHPHPSGLNPRYTFEQFVICDSNRLAHAAALAVAEMPAQAYNPLFIHGRPGLGKTHLLHAIGNYVQAYGGGLSVRYATVEEFTTRFVRAVRSGKGGDFRGDFRDADVLLIDDIQFLAEKMRTEEEFFHTFNSLYESGSQIVLTSDRKPRDIQALEARLRERFEHGLVAELEPPSFEARMAILRKRARLDALHGVSDAALAEIAAHVQTSVRSLEGALIRVVAYASLRGVEPSAALAREVLARLYPAGEDQRACTLEQIQTAAADSLGVSRDALLARDRTPRVAFARQIAMYLARELTDESLPAIGKGFGGRNHTTVMHAHRRIATALTRDPATLEAVDAVRERLRGRAADRG